MLYASIGYNINYINAWLAQWGTFRRLNILAMFDTFFPDKKPDYKNNYSLEFLQMALSKV